MNSLTNRVGYEYRCMCLGTGMAHKLQGGGYSCDPSRPATYTDPSAAAREAEAERLEGIAAKIERPAKESAHAWARDVIKAKAKALRAEAVQAHKSAEALRKKHGPALADADALIEALQKQLAQAQAERASVADEWSNALRAARLPRIEQTLGKDTLTGVILESGNMSHPHPDKQLAYSYTVASALDCLGSELVLALDVAGIDGGELRRFQAQGRHAIAGTTRETMAEALESFIVRARERLAASASAEGGG